MTSFSITELSNYIMLCDTCFHAAMLPSSPPLLLLLLPRPCLTSLFAISCYSDILAAASKRAPALSRRLKCGFDKSACSTFCMWDTLLEFMNVDHLLHFSLKLMSTFGICLKKYNYNRYSLIRSRQRKKT